MSVSCRRDQNLYVLSRDSFWWLTTLSTNRRECWESVKKLATKAELQSKGYKCVRVRLEAIKGEKS